MGQVLSLADAKSLKSVMKQRELVDTFMAGCTQKQAGLVPASIGQFGNKREEVLTLLTLLSLAVRDLILLKKSENIQLKYYTSRETALELSSAMTTRSLLGLYQAIETGRDELLRNGNIRLSLTKMCLDAGIL